MCFDPKTQMYLYVKTHQCVVTYAARSCHLISVPFVVSGRELHTFWMNMTLSIVERHPNLLFQTSQVLGAHDNMDYVDDGTMSTT